jgi:hypothetical protein
MKTLTFIDKSEWPEGAWHEECDIATWIDATTSYPCLAERNAYGAWSGLAGVDEHHPLYLVPWDADAFRFVEVHNGVTLTRVDRKESMYFTPPKMYWWIGFACTHPKQDRVPLSHGRIYKRAKYKDFHFVTKELTHLCRQLANFDQRMASAMLDEELR